MASAERQRDHTVLYAILFLFFLQLLTEFVAAIYTFGLLGTDIPPEIVSIGLLFAPVALLFWPREMRGRAFLALPFVMVVSRILAVMLDARGRMLVSGVGVAAGLIWVPVVLWQLGQREDRHAHRSLGAGLGLAVLLSALFRAAGSGLDVSMWGLSQGAGWLLGALAVYLLLRGPAGQMVRDDERAGGPASFGRVMALALGLTSAMVLVVYGFASPSVIARWTGASYLAIVATMAAAAVAFAGLGAWGHRWFSTGGRGWLWLGNGLFVVALALTLRFHQVPFPSEPSAYPLFPPAVSAIERVPLYLMLLLYPVIFVDVGLYARELVTARPSLRALGGAFTVGSLVWLVAIFAHVFTTVYDYIPVVGPAFRDRFWLVYLVAGLGMALPLLAVRRRRPAPALRPIWVGVGAVLGIATVGAVLLTRARPDERWLTEAPKPTLTVLTYNIQQGYNEDGEKAVEEQLAVMRAVDPDIIGLQESDTARLANGNDDVVRAFADALDMHTYYGPPTTVGTFGIALLSKYPIEGPRTFYMYSEGEQTAAIEARITVGETTYAVFVTHLGNGGPIVQQEAVLEVVTGQENVVLMGDFNFRPDTEQYALTTSMLDDVWLRRWPDGVDDEGVRPPKRIDHIFVSPALRVDDARYIDDPASDHPAMMAVVGR